RSSKPSDLRSAHARHLCPWANPPGSGVLAPPTWGASMSLEFYLAYVFACFVVVIVPGPTVTLIVANSMTYGSRAGLINIACTQLGLGVMMTIVLVGLTSLIETMGFWFDW